MLAKLAECQQEMARPAAIWQTVDILQQPATRNQQIRKVHGLSPTALLGWREGLMSNKVPPAICTDSPPTCLVQTRATNQSTNLANPISNFTENQCSPKYASAFGWVVVLEPSARRGVAACHFTMSRFICACPFRRYVPSVPI